MECPKQNQHFGGHQLNRKYKPTIFLKIHENSSTYESLHNQSNSSNCNHNTVVPVVN